MESRKIIGKEGHNRCKLKDNIKTDHKEKGWEGVNWIHVPQDRAMWRADVDRVMNIQFQ